MFRISFIVLILLLANHVKAQDCAAQEVISYNPGFNKDGSSIDDKRNDPASALGLPEDEDSFNFVSLGFGGELTIAFDLAIKNGQGPDISVFETTFGNRTCEEWPERAEIYVSQNNIDFFQVGSICLDGVFEIPDQLEWIKYVKFKDITDPDDFGGKDDGFDVDGITCLNGFFEDLEPIIPIAECITQNAEDSFTAFLSYNNQNATSISIPIGPENNIMPGMDLGQPTIFEPGLNENVHLFEFDGSDYVWTLEGPDGTRNSVTFNAQTPFCESATATGIMSGDTTFCGTPGTATVKVSLQGESPWSITYSDADNNLYEVDDITDSEYTFESQQITTFTLESVEDANGVGLAQGSATIDLSLIDLVFYAEENNILCEGSSKTLVFELSGTAPWSLVYKNPNGEEILVEDINAPTYSIEATEEGTYTAISVSDQFCTKTITNQTVTLEEQASPTAILSGGGVVCLGEGAEAEVSLTSGSKPWGFTYENQAGDIFEVNGLTEDTYGWQLPEAGVYTILSVSDQSICDGQVNGEAVVEVLDPPTATISIEDVVICPESSALIDIALTGTGPWSITYTDGSEEFFVETIEVEDYQLEVTAPGNYSLVSVNNQVCSGTVSGTASVQTADIPDLSFDLPASICANASAIELSGMPAGGSFEGPGVTDNLFDPNTIGEGLHTITYIFTTEEGCSVSLDQDITVLPIPSATMAGGGQICEGETAAIQVDLIGQAPFTFVYSDGSQEFTVENISETEYVLEENSTGMYSMVSVNDQSGCSGNVTGMAVVEDLSDLSVEIIAETTYCSGTDIELNANVSGSDYTLEWQTNGDGSFNDASIPNPIYTPEEGESGDINFTLTLTNQCTQASDEVTVTINEPIEVDITATPEDKITYVPVTFTPENQDADEYQWDFGNNQTGSGQVVEQTYTEPGTYEVVLMITEDGCEGEGRTTIEVEENKVVYVPNIFNPAAANPENRVIKVYGEGISEDDFIFKIVNRWNKVMFETEDLQFAQNTGWTGAALDNSEMQALGVFTYILRGKFLDGETFEKTGTITLAR